MWVYVWCRPQPEVGPLLPYPGHQEEEPYVIYRVEKELRYPETWLCCLPFWWQSDLRNIINLDFFHFSWINIVYIYFTHGSIFFICLLLYCRPVYTTDIIHPPRDPWLLCLAALGFLASPVSRWESWMPNVL